MQALNICVDIDGTITEPYYWLQKANAYFNKKIEPKDVTQYYVDEVLGVPREDYLAFYHRFCEELHLHAEIREDAQNILSELEKLHQIFYVTAREEKLEQVTRRWLDIHNLPNGKLFLLGSHYKVNKAKEVNCDIFIEDRYENAIQLALAGFHVLLIDCEYNRQHVIPGITRVFSWQHIYKEIIDYLYQKSEKKLEQSA
ncbi:hypothetical protein QBE52_16045 [Clostridiaceae bacterium 35-E11]